MKEMPVRVAGSFRDPRGYVVLNAGRLFRYLSKAGADDFNAVNATGLLDRLVADGRLLPWSPATPLAGAGPEVEKAIEHPMLRPITYPYEWTFSGLKAAALLHLDLHLDALERDVTRSAAFYDATLGTLGLRRVVQLPETDGADGIGYGVEYPVFWIDRFHPHSVKQHAAFVARNRAEVDAFHAAALKAGGSDSGPPGLRDTAEGYPPGYYAAFVLDPDGNNIEAVFRGG